MWQANTPAGATNSDALHGDKAKKNGGILSRRYGIFVNKWWQLPSRLSHCRCSNWAAKTATKAATKCQVKMQGNKNAPVKKKTYRDQRMYRAT
mmetsp:Transcript_3215/g.4348  ORF Transcript_3215/g.4348 Transcript_3215/m.4348 type:complete len:93 (-) Transcript_3215:144-422(-)